MERERERERDQYKHGMGAIGRRDHPVEVEQVRDSY